MKFNKKGQGALEYLLLIGGAVLIAVIVIALLVGMGSQNSENSKTRNEEAMAATNVPIPSVINTVKCVGTPVGTVYPQIAVNWTPVAKPGNGYNLVINNTDTFPVADEEANPILITHDCIKDSTIASMKTTNGSVSVLSASVKAQ